MIRFLFTRGVDFLNSETRLYACDFSSLGVDSGLRKLIFNLWKASWCSVGRSLGLGPRGVDLVRPLGIDFKPLGVYFRPLGIDFLLKAIFAHCDPIGALVVKVGRILKMV